HAKMRAWTSETLTAIGAPEAPVFYPFGGPDLTSVMQFFPEASFYLLLGLEAPGRLPLPEQFSGEALAADLERLRRPFESMVTSGYFVRSEIDQDLSHGQFDGILPLILICLVRDGMVPISLAYVTLDPETYQVVPLPPEARSAQAVKVSFLDRESADRLAEASRTGSEVDPEVLGKARSVFYFAQDLSNDGLLTDEPFSRMVSRQPEVNVYIKGGEYLLHIPAFSNLRELILAKTQTLLQDDSGLPVRFLKSNRWEVRLFGQYREVLAAYKQWFQEDLAATFARAGVAEPLGFELGYNSTTDGGCLILAERKAEEGSSENASGASLGS
ncbi:MAG: hypothetical protein MI919_11500, partial [Holophagales bacterium]|nr:hypothetical protein [Holophagales bacterium]